MKTWDYSRPARQMGIELCEGHPGALNVIRQLLNGIPEENAQDVFTFMASMDMRAVLIYVAYSHCDKSVQNLVNRVSMFDTSLVDSVNAEREKENAPGRCVYDGAIEWPSKLPPPSEIRRLSRLLAD